MLDTFPKVPLKEHIEQLKPSGRFAYSERITNVRAGDRRHPETLPYRCCLSTLAGFGRLCRAGPARTWARI